MGADNKKQVSGFKDLEVYQRAYRASLEVVREITWRLPPEEKYDLKDQLGRSSKAVPRLIAEGYAKKHQRKGFQKYIVDAMAESNETIVSLCHARDLYPDSVDVALCDGLIDEYEITSKQLYRLEEAWEKFSKQDYD